MLFSGYLVPDLVLPSFEDLTVSLLREKKMLHVISDIDNTLSPYEEDVPPERVLRWAEEMKSNGIVLSIVSNNGRSRVERYAAPLGVFALSDAKKPSRKPLLRAMEAAGIPPEYTCVLGDQLLTDIFSGKLCGAWSVFVPPIRDRTTLFQKTKRLLERPYLRLYREKEGTNDA